jgi:hypothetical protein
MFEVLQRVETGVILVNNVAVLHDCLYTQQVRASNSILWKAWSQ